MLSFPHQYSKSPKIPDGFLLNAKELPSSQALNRLLARCNLETHPPRLLEKALRKCDCHLSIIEKKTGRLFGFVRVTSDKGLNANIWDLCAEPGDFQEAFISVLVNRILQTIRRDMPGCSISVAAPAISLKALKRSGFILDPGGIRTMGLKL